MVNGQGVSLLEDALLPFEAPQHRQTHKTAAAVQNATQGCRAPRMRKGEPLFSHRWVGFSRGQAESSPPEPVSSALDVGRSHPASISSCCGSFSPASLSPPLQVISLLGALHVALCCTSPVRGGKSQKGTGQRQAHPRKDCCHGPASSDGTHLLIADQP